MKPVCAVLSLDARFELRAAGHESLYTSTYPWCEDVLYLEKTGQGDGLLTSVIAIDKVLAKASCIPPGAETSLANCRRCIVVVVELNSVTSLCATPSLESCRKLRDKELSSAAIDFQRNQRNTNSLKLYQTSLVVCSGTHMNFEYISHNFSSHHIQSNCCKDPLGSA